MTCSKCNDQNASGVYCQKCGNSLVPDPQFPAQNNFSEKQWVDAQNNIQRLQRENADLHLKYGQMASDHHVLYTEHNALLQQHRAVVGEPVAASVLMRPTKEGGFVQTTPENASDFPTNQSKFSVNPNDRLNEQAAGRARTFEDVPGFGVVNSPLPSESSPGPNFTASNYPTNATTPVNPSDRTFAADRTNYEAPLGTDASHLGPSLNDPANPTLNPEGFPMSRQNLATPNAAQTIPVPSASYTGTDVGLTGNTSIPVPNSNLPFTPKTMKKLNTADKIVNNKVEEELAKAEGFHVA